MHHPAVVPNKNLRDAGQLSIGILQSEQTVFSNFTILISRSCQFSVQVLLVPFALVLSSVLFNTVSAKQPQAYNYYVTNYTTKEGLPHNVVYDILKDTRGNIWVLTEGGPAKYDGSTIVSTPLPEEKSRLFNEPIDSGDNVLLRQNNIIKWIPKDQIEKLRKGVSPKDLFVDLPSLAINFKKPNNKYSPLFYDKFRNFFWCIDEKKLVGIHPEEGIQFELVLEKYFSPIGISKMFFTEEEIWFSAYQNGLYHIQIYSNPFREIPGHELNQNRRIVKDDNGNLWVANHGELKVFNSDFELIKKGESGRFHSILRDRALNIWSADTTYLIRYSENLDVYERYRLPKNSEEKMKEYRSWTWSITEDLSGNIWFDYKQQILFLDQFRKIQIFDAYNEFEVLKSNIIWEIVVKDPSHLWLCTNGGLYLLNIEKGIIARYWESGIGKYYLPALDFHDLHIDSEGVYWLVTGDNGLIKWIPEFNSEDHQKYITHTFNLSTGLPSNVMHGIYEDSNNCLWISSENGLIQFHKLSSYFKVYQEQEGISNVEFNRISHHQDDQGNIYFGSVGALTFFNPDDFKIDSIPSSIGILSLKKYHNDLYENYVDRFNKDKQIEFETPYDHFVLTFGSINPLDKTLHKYSFRIGQHNNWIPSTNNTVYLNNLPYGEHFLNIKKENIAGQQVGLLKVRLIVPYPFFTD